MRGHFLKGFAMMAATAVTAKAITKKDPLEPHKTCNNSNKETRLQQSIKLATDHCESVQRKQGLPGLAVSVSVNGNTVFEQGFGYADMENSLPMRADSVMRIASISKSITMAMLAKQMEEGKVDIDQPIQTYLPDFPIKKWEGKDVTITVRHLLSHISGIRHYRKKEDLEKKKEEETSDSDYKEFFSQTGCDSVTKAMEIFKNDELINKPGTKYFYTTHGWTVVSAVIEKIAGVSFEKHTKRMFQFWGLNNTYLDEHDPIIPNRARFYRRKTKTGGLINAPWVDNSCKWAGGGFLSTVQDLVRFAHIMLYSAQQQSGQRNDVGAYLKRETVEKLWTGENATNQPYVDNLYGLGWVVGDPFKNCFYCNSREEKIVAHSGGAVGAVSILMIQLPPANGTQQVAKNKPGEIKGVVVAMITNLQDGGLTQTAKKIANEFAWLMDSKG